MRRWLVISVVGAMRMDGAGLTIEVVEGSGAVMNVRDRTSPAPRVRVVDSDQKPVAGATVTFRLPEAGPSARFDDGRIFVSQTDAHGEATPRRMRPNTQVGPWEIRVSAAHGGLVARVAIQQTNAAPVEAYAAARKTRTLYWLAAVSAGVAAATSIGVVRGGSGTAGAAAPRGAVNTSGAVAGLPLTITAGNGSISAP